MQALEIRHFRRITRLDQRLEARADQFNQATAQHRLLTKQVGFDFFLEGRLDDARTATAIGGCIGQRDFQRIARRVLRHGHQRRHAATLLVFGTHGVARALGRDQEHVQVGTGFDDAEMDRQTVGERKRRTRLQVLFQRFLVQRALALIGGQHHDHVGPLGGVGGGHHLEAGGFGLGNSL